MAAVSADSFIYATRADVSEIADGLTGQLGFGGWSLWPPNYQYHLPRRKISFWCFCLAPNLLEGMFASAAAFTEHLIPDIEGKVDGLGNPTVGSGRVHLDVLCIINT